MQILTIRYYQLKRDLGILFFVILALLFCVSYFAFSHPKQIGYYAVLVIAYLFYSFHKNRNDLSFAIKHFENAIWQIQVEYQLFLLPVSLPILVTEYWLCFFLLHVIVFLIPLSNFNDKLSFKFHFITRYFESDYIFISGIRKNIFVLIPIIIIALILSPLKLFPLIALFIANSIIFSFFEVNESVQLLLASGKTPKQFLSSLVFSSTNKLLVLNLPVLVVNTIFNSDLLLFNLYFLVYNVLMLMTIISSKYSDYKYKKQGNSTQTKMVIMTLGLFIPFLSILTLSFYIQSRSEAIKNLKNYLDDSTN